MTTVLLILIGGVFLIVAVGMLAGRPALTRAALLAPVLVAAMLALGLWVEAPRAPMGSYGKVWVSLQALRFRLAQVEPVRLGGGVATDDVVLSPGLGAAARRIGRGPLPAGFLEFSRQGKDAVRITLKPQAGSMNRAVVRIEAGRDKRYLGARPAPAAWTPCLADCAGPTPKLAEVRKGQVFASRFTPLLGAPADAPALVFAPTKPLAGLSPTALLVVEGDMGPAGAEYVLPRGQVAEVSLYEAVPSSPQRTATAGEPGRLMPRGVFKLAYDGEQLTVTPRWPETDVLDFTDEQTSRVVRIVSGEAAAMAAGDETFAIFTLMGHSFDAELEQASLDVARDSRRPSVLHRVDGSQQIIEGAREIGGDRSVDIAVRTLDLNSGLGYWLVAFGLAALLASSVASLKLRLGDPLAAMAFSALDVLLTMRLLVAVEGSFVDSSAKAQAAVPAALIAMPLGAFLALAAHPGARDQLTGLVTLAIVTLAAIAVSWAGIGHIPSLTIVALPLLLVSAAFVVARGARKATDEGAGAAGRLRKLFQAYDRADHWISMAVIGSAVILLLRLVLGFGPHWRESVIVGGNRFALSLLFVPLTLAISAPLLARVAAGWDGRSERFAWGETPVIGAIWRGLSRWPWFARRPWPTVAAVLCLAVILLVGVAVSSAAVNDNGFFVFILPVVVGAAAAYLARPVAGRGADLALAAVAVLPALAALLFWVLGFSWALYLALGSLAICTFILFVRPSAAWLTPLAAVIGLLVMVNVVAAAGERPAQLMSLDQALLAKTNDMRLFAVLGPERLAQLGTRGADGLQDTNDHMRIYGDTIGGRGYFNLPPPTVLRLYHESDNVSAVHLISPFGRLGALGFILVSGGVAVVALFVAIGRGTASAWLGGLAALTLALVSTYMVLANLLAAPFTGRNVYLLAAASTSDLLEGLLLMTLVIATLGSRQLPEEP